MYIEDNRGYCKFSQLIHNVNGYVSYTVQEEKKFTTNKNKLDNDMFTRNSGTMPTLFRSFNFLSFHHH